MIKKQSWEEFRIAGSILKVQDSDETIDLNSSQIFGYDKNGNDVTASIIDPSSKSLVSDPDGEYSDNALSIRIRGGNEDGSPYKITFRLVTSKGNKWEIDVSVKVKER